VPTARVAARPVAERSGLKILVAGADKDARGPVEAAVKRAFSGREAEPWSVSLVRLGTLWSVTMRGPGERFRNLSFTAEERGLGEAVAEALAGGREPAAPGPGPSPAVPARAAVQERHVCQRCQQGILVIYDAQPDESKELAPLACPHCWAVSQVEVGAWAAVGGDYRAEKA
jgi:hypothetical protein